MPLWLGVYICNWLSGWLVIFLCLVVGFRPRFHSGHLTPSGVSCLKRQTTLRWLHWIFALIQWPHGNVQNRLRRPLNFSANVTHAHCILGSSRKLTSINMMYIHSLLKRSIEMKTRRHRHWRSCVSLWSWQFILHFWWDKTCMSHVDVLCVNEITNPKTWPRPGRLGLWIAKLQRQWTLWTSGIAECLFRLFDPSDSHMEEEISTTGPTDFE